MGAKVFVGNLEFKTTQREVEELFAEAGSVREVFLPADRATGRPRGFAFVEFDTEEEAAKAIEMFDGYELGGRALRVNPAEDRPQRRGGPPFAGGYGGGGDRFPGKPKGSRRNVRARKRSL
jgi:RNA recognition motif-containing protein